MYLIRPNFRLGQKVKLRIVLLVRSIPGGTRRIWN